MKIFLKRWMLYLLLPAALVLLFVPLNTTVPERVERETVFLGMSETLHPLKPVEEAPPAEPGTMEDAWHQLNKQQAALASPFSHDTTVTNAVDLPVVQESDFSSAPALHEALEDLSTRCRLGLREQLDATPLETVPVEEWTAFRTAHTEQGAFQYGNQLFTGTTAPLQVNTEVEIPHLKTGCKIAGGLFLLLSLLLLPGIAVRPTNGIRVGKRGAIVLWDLIIIGIGSLFMWMAMDAVLHWLFGTEWWGGDEMMAGMSLFWITLVSPLMAFITTATAIQTLWITQDGIALKGLMGMRALPWSDVQRIDLSGIRGPQSGTGGLPTKTVTRHLIIVGESGSLRILEPPMASTKKEILQALKQFAPQELTEHIAPVAKEWL